MTTPHGGEHGGGRNGTTTEHEAVEHQATEHQATEPRMSKTEQGEEGAVTAPTTTEVDWYLEAVAVHLADLPESERAELLEDLRTHLTEVEAEGEGSLTDRLGPPASYAAELRVSAGLQQPTPTADVGPARPSAWRQRRARFGAAAREVPGAAPVFAFFAELRPVWWVARGIGLALLPALVDPVPPELIVVLAVPFVIVSVWLGKRARDGRPVLPNGFVVALNAALLLVLLIGVSSQDGPGDPEPAADSRSFTEVTDLWVYDSQGRLVQDARVYDQNGNPVIVYDPFDQKWGYGPRDGVSADPGNRENGNVYPRPHTGPPYGEPDPGLAPPPTIAPLPPPTGATPSPSTSVSPTPTPNASPTR